MTYFDTYKNTIKENERKIAFHTERLEKVTSESVKTTVKEEIESLKKANEKLEARLAQLKADYKAKRIAELMAEIEKIKAM